jgi:charged multivesicular body protein 4
MASFMSYFGARRDPKQSARDAIVTLRQQLQMIEKKEEYLQKKIDDELKKAKANAVSNKAGALVKAHTYSMETWTQ